MTAEIRQISLEEIIRSSPNKFYNQMPKPVIRAIEWIIKQDELNRLLAQYGHLDGIDFIKALLFDEFKVKIHFLGNQDFDPNQRYVYIANHPLGGIDAMSHLYFVHQRHGNVKSPSNELFNYIPNLHPLILGVNVFGRNSKEKIRELNELFASDWQVMMFPAGEVSRWIGTKIVDPPWKKTFVQLAVRYKRDIVASYISGRNSLWFYLIAKLRKLSGLKLYLETLLLPRQMLRGYGMDVYFWTLPIIRWQEVEQSGKSLQWWTEEIYRRVHFEAKAQLKAWLKSNNQNLKNQSS